MELLLLLIQIPFLVYLIRYISKQHSDPLLINSYYYLLSIKVTFGFLLGIIYLNYYKGGDTLYYQSCFDELSGLFHKDFEAYCDLILRNKIPDGFANSTISFSPRAFFFVRLMSPFYIATGSNYWMMAIYLSVFSFSGFWILSDTLIRLFKVNSLAILSAFFLFPSVIFWSSGVLKESLISGAIAYCISIALNAVHGTSRFTFVKIFVLLILSWILFMVKFYYFAVLFAILIPYCGAKILSLHWELFKHKRSYRIIAFLTFMIVFGILATLIHPLLHIDTIVSSLYYNYDTTLKVSKGQNTFVFEGLSTEALSFLPHALKALCNGLFGPFLWQSKKIISLIVGIENTLLLILFATFVLTNFRKDKLKKIDLEEVSLVLYVSILAIFMAFASPNWGSLVRYKIGYSPFFLLLILNRNPFITQLEERFSFLKRKDKESATPVQSKKNT